MNNNTGKNKIVLFEYCKVERAAEMLGCEIDDLIHLASIGVISLSLNIPLENNLQGMIHLHESESESIGDELYGDDGPSHAFWHSKLGLKSIFEDPTGEFNTDEEERKAGVYIINGYVHGLWNIPSYITNNMQLSNHDNVELYNLYPTIYFNGSYSPVKFELADCFMVNANDLWITKDNLVKTIEYINNNSGKIDDLLVNKPKDKSDSGANKNNSDDEKLVPQQIDMIRALIQLHFGKDSVCLYEHDKFRNELKAAFEKNNIVYNMASDKTTMKWMNSFRIPESKQKNAK